MNREPGTGLAFLFASSGFWSSAQFLTQSVMDEIERPVVAPVDEVAVDGPQCGRSLGIMRQAYRSGSGTRWR